MAWRVAAAVIIAVFTLAVGQSILIGPAVTIQEDLNATGDYSDLDGVSDYNGNDVIDPSSGPLSSWLNMGLMAMFGLMAWGIWRVVRRELTRGGGL